MDGLHMVLTSFADMTPDRLVEVARAFDRHPNLRPLRVGGDPARIKVEPSLETVITTHGLPIDWLTVRRNGRYPDFEGGEIKLYPGRGGWLGLHGGAPGEYLLTGHYIQQHWVAGTVETAGVVQEIASLFEDLIAAIDPAFACVAINSVSPEIRLRLPNVCWLTYLGPAFTNAHPKLRSITDARANPTGGVLLRTAEDPLGATDNSTLIQTELEEILGHQAFAWAGRPQNPSLPTEEQYVAASPGTTEMPWVSWVAQKVDHDRAKRHLRALQRFRGAIENRGHESSPSQPAIEWSTSMDLSDWLDLAKYLRRKLGGDFTTAIGKALVTVIATAPVGAQGDVVLRTRIGTVDFSWLVDDETTLDLCINGTRECRDICNAWSD